MDNLQNGIHAYAMDRYIRNQVEEIEDEDKAQSLYDEWLAYGVPDGSNMGDCMDYYGSKEEFEELQKEFMEICDSYNISTNYLKELTDILLKISQIILDNID